MKVMDMINNQAILENMRGGKFEHVEAILFTNKVDGVEYINERAIYPHAERRDEWNEDEPTAYADSFAIDLESIEWDINIFFNRLKIISID